VAYFLPLQSIVLENLSHGFLQPNILDIKLGTVLYDETASPEKVERMLKAAKATTSLETGVRLTGFQVSLSKFSSKYKHSLTSYCPGLR
jgi:1D-myo-inositol-tetrakisphosphate 5-kinase/inositol-polyphosphate multikinase